MLSNKAAQLGKRPVKHIKTIAASFEHCMRLLLHSRKLQKEG